MIITIKRLLEWLFLFLLFLFASLVLYKLLFVLNEQLNPIEKQKEPIGRSIKVIDMQAEENLSFKNEITHRLRIYYLVGE